MADFKTYRAKYAIGLNMTFILKDKSEARVRFGGGSVYNNTKGGFSTSDKNIQDAMESSSNFNKMYVLESTIKETITEKPATEAPKTTETPATEAPKTTETPATEAPKTTETPVTEATKTAETPATEAPKTTETPATEATKTAETPATEKPATETFSNFVELKNFLIAQYNCDAADVRSEKSALAKAAELGLKVEITR